jgi:hypothetical protein
VKPSNRQHLSDERLIDAYFAAAGSQPPVDAVRAECDHVQTCEACGRRYRELTASLERLREQAVAEADAYFTPDRLAAQRQHVLRHLEGAEHPARVIPFPQATARPRASRVHTPLFRWVAAAAAAGLLIGVSAGRLLSLRPGVSPRPASSVQARAGQPARMIAAPGFNQYARSADLDEEFLSEVEAAVSQQRIAALQALDAMTPRIQDAVARVK